MTRKRALGAITGLALAAGATAVATTSASSDSAGVDSRRSAEVIRLVGKEVSSGFLDLGEADFSDGDQVHFTNDLYSGDTKVGEDGGWCVVTRLTAEGAATFKCDGANSLPEGQITVQGLVTYGPDEEVKAEPYHFAITGGTGKYRAARGTVEIQEVSGEEFNLTFRLVRERSRDD
jgi:hypothetical protein